VHTPTHYTLLFNNNWPKIVSIVELDSQAVLNIGTHIVKKCCSIHHDVKWTSRSVNLLLCGL